MTKKVKSVETLSGYSADDLSDSEFERVSGQDKRYFEKLRDYQLKLKRENDPRFDDRDLRFANKVLPFIKREQLNRIRSPSFIRSVENVGQSLLNTPSDLSHLAMGVLNELGHHTDQVLPDIGHGLRSFAQNSILPGALQLAKAPFQALPRAVRPKSLDNFLSSVQVPRYDTHPGKIGNPSPIEQTTMMLASLPFLGLAGRVGTTAARAALGGLPARIGKNLLTKGAVHTGGAALGGALGSPAMGVSPQEGALFGVATPLLEKPIAKLGSRFLEGIGEKGPLTAEEFKDRRSQIPEGISMPLGDVAQDPRFREKYSAISGLIGSGGKEPYAQLKNHLLNQMEDIAGTEHHGLREGVNDYLFKEKSANYRKAKQATQAAYDDVTKLADELETPFKDSELRKVIKNNYGDLKNQVFYRPTRIAGNENPALRRSATGTQTHGDIYNLYKELNGTNLATFKDARRAESKINSTLKRLIAKDTSPESIRYAQLLKEGINKSFDNSAEEFDHPELLQAYKKAKQKRIDQSRFENIGTTKTPFFKLEQSKSPDRGGFLASYLKPDKGVRENKALLGNLLDNISDKGRQVAAGSFLMPQNIEGIPPTISEFARKLENLGPDQRKMLLGEKAPIAENFLRLTKMFGDAKNPEFVPKTGWTGSRNTQLWGSILAAITSLAAGHPLGALLPFVPPLVGQAGQRLLRSEGLKNIYQRGLERREEIPSKKRGRRRKGGSRHSIALPIRAMAGQDDNILRLNRMRFLDLDDDNGS